MVKLVLGAALISCTLLTSTISSAVEPRPWLCREIPVFSGSKPLTWRATRHGSGRWLMTFMRYDPAGGHDGFTLESSQSVGNGASGTLETGQWYAEALYYAHGHWICPGNAGESETKTPGAITDLCYGEDDDSCDVRLIVK